MQSSWVSVGVACLLVVVVFASANVVSARETGPSPHLATQLLPLAVTTKTVTVGKMPTIALYDPATTDVYVANEGSNTVSAISSTTYAVTTIKVGTEPVDIIYAPSTKSLYVVNSEKSISVISSANKVVHTVTFPSGTVPISEIYDPANGDVYVVCDTTTGSQVDAINQATFALTIVKLPTGALFSAYDNATLSLVVSSGPSNEVTAISSTNVATTVTLTAGIWPSWMVYNPHDSDLYITDIGETEHGFTKTGNVSVLSSANKIIATLKVGNYPTIGWYDPKNFDIYEINTGLPSGKTYPTSTVSVIATTNKVVKTLTVGKYAVVAFYDPKNSEMYIACPASNETFAITSANAITAMVVTKQYAGAALYDPALGEMLAFGFATFNGAPVADTIVTLIPSTNTGTSTVTLGLGPVAGTAYDPTDSGFWAVNMGATTVSVIL
ncbi:MAG: hypothetical protein WCB18_01295 [Thermoplasmata archaeon]